MSTGGATELEIAELPGMDFKAPTMGSVNSPIFMESPVLTLN